MTSNNNCHWQNKTRKKENSVNTFFNEGLLFKWGKRR
jgi:hypothetical protein